MSSFSIFRPFAFLVIIVFFLTSTIPACAANRSPARSKTGSEATASEDLIEAFEQTYNEIQTKVQQGQLPAQMGTRADELRMSLKKYLIKSEAQMKVLELDVLHGSEEEREAGIKEMVTLSAAQERTKLMFLQDIQALMGGSTPHNRMSPSPEKQETKTKSNNDKEKGEKTVVDKNGQKWKVKDLDIEIEVAPEKVDNGLP